MKLSPAFIYVFLNVLDMFIVADVLIHLPLHEEQPGLKTLKTMDKKTLLTMLEYLIREEQICSSLEMHLSKPIGTRKQCQNHSRANI